MRSLVSIVVGLALTLVASTDVSAASAAVDATLSRPAARYVPTAASLLPRPASAGDTAEADFYASGAAIEYGALVLNGDGLDANGLHPFIKLQSQSNAGHFTNAACYLGNNASMGTFGLGFFTLTQPFASAHMRASQSGSTVTIALTNVDGGALPNQTYMCTGAPSPAGNKPGVASLADNTTQIDNFGTGALVLDTFSYAGTLGSTGNWVDAAPGMHATGSRAIGGDFALSFFVGGAICHLEVNGTSFVDGDPVNIQVFQVGNASAAPLAIEYKFWIEVPGLAPVGLSQGGADGSQILPAGFNFNLGPIPFFTVMPSFPRGDYAIGCRFVNPVTGAPLAESEAPFNIH